MRSLWILAAPVALFGTPVAAAETTVGLINFQFVPNDVTIQVGDTVKFVNQGGTHNVQADDGSFGNSPSSAAWTFSRTFTQVGEVFVHCSVHSSAGVNINSGMNARINVTAAAVSFSINQGISGAWYNAQTSGQGFLFDIDADTKFMFAGWFTYEPASATNATTDWLTLQGNYSGAQAQVPIYRTGGGTFDQSSQTSTSVVGNATVTFTSCTAGTVDYQLTSPAKSGTIAITRLVPGTDALCEQLNSTNAAGGSVQVPYPF